MILPSYIIETTCTLEEAKLLKKLGYNIKSDLYWVNESGHVKESIIKQYGELSDDGYYELTKYGGGNLNWNQVYERRWVLRNNTWIDDPNKVIIAPYIIDADHWIGDNYNLYVLGDKDKNGYWWKIVNLETMEVIKETNNYYNSMNDTLHTGLLYVLKKLSKKNDRKQ